MDAHPRLQGSRPKNLYPSQRRLSNTKYARSKRRQLRATQQSCSQLETTTSNMVAYDCSPCTENRFSVGSNSSAESIDISMQNRVEEIAGVDEEISNVHLNSTLVGCPYIVRGSFHQGDPRFPGNTRGKQCTANAAAALAMCTILDPSVWSSEDIDSVLTAGDDLYTDSMRARPALHPNEDHPDYLAAGELSTEFQVRSENCILLIKDTMFGHLDSDFTEDGFPNLRERLNQFLAADKCGIVTSNFISVAIFRLQNTVWMFDSHSRDSAGKVTPDGRACLIGFPDIESLYRLLRMNIAAGRIDDPCSDTYDLIEVQLQRVHRQDESFAVADVESRSLDASVNGRSMFEEEETVEEVSSKSIHREDTPIEDPDIQREISTIVEEERLIEEHELEISSCGPDGSLRDIDTLQGRGIYAFQYVWKTLHEVFDEHSRGVECHFRNIQLIGYQRVGLKTLLRFRCSMCSFGKSIMSEPEDDNVLDVHQSAVLGSLSAGIGHSQLEQVLAAMDVKCMAASTFRRYHDVVYDGLSKTAALEMEVAGKEECKLAIERGDVIHGIPHIPVIADGSWMKRSYKLGKYDSLSGLGAIVGFHTKKVLFIGVRNKFCSVCDPALKKGLAPREHTCYKNWARTDSSTSMEADAILEGFRSSLDQHGLIYSTLIADGDSSVYKKITDYHPYREHDVYVKKVECGNHLRRNVCSKVKEIAKRKGIPGPIREMIANSVPRFNFAVTKAVKYRLQQTSISTAERNKLLKRDIMNAPSHIFGEHARCASLGYFCDGIPKKDEQNFVPELKRLGLFDALEDTVSRLSHHTDSLLYNVSNNAVESYNGVVSKFIGGKRINYGQRNSYNARSLGAAVQFNSKKVLTRYREVMTKEPSQVASTMEANRERWIVLQKERVARAKLNRTASRAEPRSQTVDKDYGPSSQKPDLGEEAYAIELDRHTARLKDLQQNRIAIERETVDQASSSLWMCTRRKLLTASKFGKVCLMRKDTSCKSTVLSILYPSSLQNNPAVDYGRRSERIARSELERRVEVRVEKCGLFVDPEILGLGASPDGLIGDDGIVEIKCPYSARELTPEEAINNKNSSIRRIFNNVDGTEMNSNHEYYFQVQGQLHITGRDYCLFMVWMPKGSRIVKVIRDDEFWERKMKPPLVQFYNSCLVPEIVDSRFIRSMPIRDPPYILEAQQVTAKRRLEIAAKAVAKRQKEASEGGGEPH